MRGSTKLDVSWSTNKKHRLEVAHNISIPSNDNGTGSRPGTTVRAVDVIVCRSRWGGIQVFGSDLSLTWSTLQCPGSQPKNLHALVAGYYRTGKNNQQPASGRAKVGITMKRGTERLQLQLMSVA